jgi:hypothetical protein
MRNVLYVGFMFAFALGTTPAFAIDAPKLPASAKKLSGKEIVALYDGATVSFNNFTAKESLTGTVTYDFKSKTHKGHYVLGTQSGDFEGPIRINGNTFCHKENKGKETCSSVYTDGSSIYETNAKGAV